MNKFLILAAILLPVTGCRGTPDWTADEASNAIAEKLAAGKVDEAEEIYDDIEGSDDHEQAVFATVYDRAGNYYRKEKFDASIRMLRFLHEHYEDAEAPRVALLYAHMLRRGQIEGAPADDDVKEMRSLVKEIRAKDAKYPTWVDLAAAQAAVDAGRVADARQEYATCKSKWDGSPREAQFYVEEFDRYFQTLDGGA